MPAKLAAAKKQGASHPDIGLATSDGFRQLKAFLLSPGRPGWSRLAHEALLLPMQLMAGNSAGLDAHVLLGAFDLWKAGAQAQIPLGTESGNWVMLEKLGSASDDLLVVASSTDAINGLADRFHVWVRLPDSQETREQSGYVERWRRFLALANLFQFCERSTAIVSSEASDDSTPGLDLVSEGALDERWLAIQEEVVVALNPFLMQMAMAGIAVPDVEVYLSDSSECFAEIAWRLPAAMGSSNKGVPVGIALLVGDQTSFASEWQQAGWSVITLADVQAKGTAWLLSMLPIGE
jgi:DEAD/DEAH box helicase domain-containing protein